MILPPPSPASSQPPQPSRPQCRGVAQPGSALAWGASGRWFKSSRPDHWRPLIFFAFARGSGASSFGKVAAGSKLVAKVSIFRIGTTGAGARSASGPESSLATAARISLLRQRADPQHAAVLGAAPVRAVVRSLDVAAGRFAAAVLVALDDAGAA